MSVRKCIYKLKLLKEKVKTEMVKLITSKTSSLTICIYLKKTYFCSSTISYYN